MSRLRVLLVAIVATLVAAPAAMAARTVNVPRKASIVLQGEERGDLAGASVARAGDVNGDGRGDVIVGAPLADPLSRSNAGAAYVVFGGGKRGRLDLGTLGAGGFRIAGAVSLSMGTRHQGRNPLTSGAGAVVAGAGDVNGDGLADLLVSGRFGLPFTRTAVFVVFGKRDTAPVDLASLGASGYVIQAVGEVEVIAGYPVGDMNSDGRADTGVGVGVSGDEGSGSMFVVYGKADPAPVEVNFLLPGQPWGFRVSGIRDSLGIGTAIAPAGDVNGDGLGDLLLGAAGAGLKPREYGRGAVFTLLGSRTPDDPTLVSPGKRFNGEEVDGPRRRDGFGFSVARIGGGFIAGAPGNVFRPLRGRGGAWIARHRGARLRLAGPRTGGPAGVSVDGPGDVAGPGDSDALVVTYGRRRGPAKVLVFSSHGRLVTTFRGLRNDREARISAAGAGDVGGNRRNDLIFGSPGANHAYVLDSR
jgi:FG-GAP repeat